MEQAAQERRDNIERDSVRREREEDRMEREREERREYRAAQLGILAQINPI